ncbi:flavin reductase family protein [Clostridium chromiireducens]|uniref:Flavin reductase family protein n=1 Tax=Clostridium chromiireducens TaxID=225345 RepID=A0A964W465_9CLOT|nr:flavin reductase [Clostridium chromiireducens]MVX65873.1 flavin reductase family protein [Clostridium chromiireducens]
MEFKEIEIKELNINPFSLIGDDWLLITAGTEGKFNTMTASWGGLGVFWGKNAATIYVRPGRYTKEFIDSNDTFTLSFFKEEYKKALHVCGSLSGRNTNKVEAANLSPIFDGNNTYFDEAKMVIVCKKMYHAEIIPENFDNKSFDEKIYPAKDYHTIYIGEILKVLIKE